MDEFPLDSCLRISQWGQQSLFPGPWRSSRKRVRALSTPAPPPGQPLPGEAGRSLAQRVSAAQGSRTVFAVWIQFPPDSSFCYKHNKSERDRWQDLIHFYQMFLGCEYKTENEGSEREVGPPREGRARIWGPMDQTVPSVLTTWGLCCW